RQVFSFICNSFMLHISPSPRVANIDQLDIRGAILGMSWGQTVRVKNACQEKTKSLKLEKHFNN
ncbi:hypothetical protein R0K05_19790, partial [Planococcus sp. SIMBA_160]